MEGSLRNQFLIAMPGLRDSLFTGSVTLLCEHNDNGAMGLIINHPLDLCFKDIFANLDLEAGRDIADEPVLAGGPVNMDRGFVLHHYDGKNWGASLQVSPDVCLTSSKDIIEAIAHNEGPEAHLIALGYSGWAAGQLEAEMAANAWLTCPADEAILFSLPYEERAKAAASLLGVALSLLSGESGTA